METTAATRTMIVLVVDDELDVEDLFKQRFRREIKSGALLCQFAHSGEEALAFLRNNGPTELVLILSDINMPGMSGLELLKQVKQSHASLKVFMITAYGDSKNYNAAIAAGADDFINKPIDFDSLKTKIYGALGIA
jgi:DNA-binding NtrC family response regulator